MCIRDSYTTDADYERMKEIWDQEKIMGDDTPFWEDVPVGFELPKTCSDGPVTYMHMMYWYDIGDLSIYSREDVYKRQRWPSGASRGSPP